MVDYRDLTRRWWERAERFGLRLPRRLNHFWMRWRLNAKEKRLMAENRYNFDKAKAAGKSTEELKKLEAELMLPVSELRDDKRILESHDLLTTMHRLGIPYSTDDREIWDPYDRGLTDKGRSEFRSAIRKERNEKWELRLRVFTLVIGMLGALIGLVSVWRK
jgi:hypothetical protein